MYCLEEKYYENLSKELLDEGFLSGLVKTAATALGYTGMAGLAGFGAIMLGKSAISKKGKVNKFFKKIFKNGGDIDFDSFEGKEAAKRENDTAKEWENKIPEIYKAIKDADWDLAKKLWSKSKLNNNDEAARAVIIWITDMFGEPPLFVYPTANKTYFAIKQVIGIKYAKAAANAVIAALKQNKSYYSDIDINLEEK